MSAVSMVRWKLAFSCLLLALSILPTVASSAGRMPGNSVPLHHPDDKDLIDHLVLEPSLKTFTKLIAKAGLIETLKGDGPYTIFAPNDAAFTKLGAVALQALTKDKALLRRTLNFHIVSGKILAKDYNEGPLKTLATEPLMVKLKGSLTINGAKIAVADVPASNGTIHIVNTVFVPPPPKPAK